MWFLKSPVMVVCRPNDPGVGLQTGLWEGKKKTKFIPSNSSDDSSTKVYSLDAVKLFPPNSVCRLCTNRRASSVCLLLCSDIDPAGHLAHV